MSDGLLWAGSVPLPPSVNAYYEPQARFAKGGGRVLGTGRRPDAQAYQVEVWNQIHQSPPIPPAVLLDVRAMFWFASRRPDIDNPLKGLLDALAKGLGFNDRRVWRLIVNRGIDKARPRVDVEIWRCEPLKSGGSD